MAWRQYSSCRTVRRMGTFGPGVEPAVGAGVLVPGFGSGGPWRLHLDVRVGALRLWPAGQREGGDGTPPRGRRPTVVEVQDMGPGSGGQGSRDVEMRASLHTREVGTRVVVYIKGRGVRYGMTSVSAVFPSEWR